MEKLIQKTTFEKRILMRDFRRAFNIKQGTLAEAINKKQSTISRMEAEDKELNAEEIKALMDALGIKAEDILKHEGNLVLIGNNFKQIKEVHYKEDASEEELKTSKTIISELKEEVKELKNQFGKYSDQIQKKDEQIQRLFEMLEVKHHTMA